MTDILEQDTPHVKGSRKTTPPKADHKHEYFRVITWNHIRRFNGTTSAEKYKFSLPTKCIECGHENSGARNSAVEIEVSVKEFRKLSLEEEH